MKDLKKIFLLCLICGFLFSFRLIQNPSRVKETTITAYYLEQLGSLENDLYDLEKNILQKSSRSSLQQIFLQARVSYKKVAILTEYFNAYETKMLNGPALKWVEENDPQKIIEPHGFQVIEEILFNPKTEIDYSWLKSETEKMLAVLRPLKKESDMGYKFSDKLIFEALQSSLIRLTALGISGFDSPIAQNSLSEAKNTLEGFKSIFGLYTKIYDKKTDAILDKAISYLTKNNSFVQFDRLYFIKNYINPLYTLIVQAKIDNSLIVENDKVAINPFALSLFDSNTFNINSFSPTKRYQSTPERIVLGKKLFFDPILSSTKKRSCATCHQPALAFTDGLKTALAVDEKTYLLRNTPTLWNSALQKNQFYDSRATVLENQLSDVVHNQEEMKGSLKESVSELQKHPEYADMFSNAYPDDHEKITQYNIANAISSYMRSLVSLNSRFDEFMRGDETKMSKKEKSGFNLFMGKAKCGTCHFIPLFNGLAPPFFARLGIRSIRCTGNKK